MAGLEDSAAQDAEADGHIALKNSPGGVMLLSLFLSLYLLLLAIFILLNSITDFETSRVRQALGSVSDKFRTNADLSDQDDRADVASGDSLVQTQFFSGLRKLFAEHLPIAKLNVVDAGNVMRATVPTRHLFKDGEMTLHPRSEELMTGVADSLVLKQPDIRYEVELLIPVGRRLPKEDKIGADLNIRRASAFARKLREMGVDGTSIGIGIYRGNPRHIRLNFFSRRVIQAAISFKELAGKQ